MSTFWWNAPGWTETRCSCGARIWPEGDPDWGACYACFTERLDYERQQQEEYEAYCREEEARLADETPGPTREEAP